MVILKLIKCNQVTRLILIITIENVINMVIIEGIWILIGRNLKRKIIYFQYHLNCQYIHDKNGAIEIDLLESSRNANSHYYYWKCYQHGHNRRDLNLDWTKWKKKLIYFQYHLNCQRIHGKNGAIEVDLLQSSRNANSNCYYWKCHQHDLNRRYLKLCWIKLRKTITYFQYHLNGQYIHDKNGDIEDDLVQSSRKVNSHYYYWKCHQHGHNRRDLNLDWTKFKKEDNIYSISPQLSVYSWQKWCYWNWSIGIKSQC